MRKAQSAAALAVMLATASGSVALADTPQQCTAQWDAMQKARQAAPLSYQVFMAGCLAGRAPVSLPTVDAPDGAPAGATARCRDGSYTTTTVSLGACAHHRGVLAILR
jgi:hypothetical protein